MNIKLINILLVKPCLEVPYVHDNELCMFWAKAFSNYLCPDIAAEESLTSSVMDQYHHSKKQAGTL